MKRAFDKLAHQLWDVRTSLTELQPELVMECDQEAAEDLLTKLDWATENCTVIGLHQIGKALEDNMGFGHGTEKKKPASQTRKRSSGGNNKSSS